MANYTASDVLAEKKPLTTVVPIVLDGTLADRWNSAKDALDTAQSQDASGTTDATREAVERAEEEVDRLRPDVERGTINMTFQALGRRHFQELVEANPPTDKSRRKAKRAGIEYLEWDPDTFMPAKLVA
jgi:hypothetical protein